MLLPACAALALAIALRGGLPGTAVADDYSFLERLRFQRPLDVFDSMGGAYYWRPLSRQLYFSAVGAALPAHPWVPAALHAVLLLLTALALHRIARRAFPPPVAAAIACWPLLAEPARVLVAWPSGSQHLLGGLFAAVAIGEALAGRWVTAALAAFAGVLGHESAAWALAAFPVVAWLDTRSARRALVGAGVAALVGLAWLSGYAWARGHGVLLPTDGAPLPLEALRIVPRALTAAFNLEDRSAVVRVATWVAVAGLAALAGVRLARDPRRHRPVLLASALLGLVFLLGTLPLAALPDWNAWRDWVPSLALGTGFGTLLAQASPRLLLGCLALKLVLLVTAPTGPATVSTRVPPGDSHVSFPRLVRLQRTVESTRRALLAGAPRLPAGAQVRRRWLPQHAAFAFQESDAVRVWYGDSTARWLPFAAGSDARSDAIVEYVVDAPWPARLVDLRAAALFREAALAFGARRYALEDSLLASASEFVAPGPFAALVLDRRARVSLRLEQFARADSLNRASLAMAENEPQAWVTAGVLAALAGDLERASEAVAMCLALDPTNPQGLELAAKLQR